SSFLRSATLSGRQESAGKTWPCGWSPSLSTRSRSIRSSPCDAGRGKASLPPRTRVHRRLFVCATRFRSRASLPFAKEFSKRGGREFPEDRFLPCGLTPRQLCTAGSVALEVEVCQ